MNQNARSNNVTDADSPMLSMVEFLHGTGRKKESHIPSNDTFCCNIHPTPARDDIRLPWWKRKVVGLPLNSPRSTRSYWCLFKWHEQCDCLIVPLSRSITITIHMVNVIQVVTFQKHYKPKCAFWNRILVHNNISW